MGFAAFVSNPKAYLGSHEMQLNGNGSSLVPLQITMGVPGINAAGGFSVQYTHVATHSLAQGAPAAPATNWGASLARKVKIAPRRRITYVPAAGGPAPGFRLLPWEATNVTFMELGAGANFAVTGPLTGCTIAVARHPVTGSVWFFHANVAGGGGALFLVTKRLKVRHAGVVAGFPIGGPAGTYRWCEMGSQYHGLAFVWGRLRGPGVWKFYIHDIQPAAPGGANQVTNSKWTEL